MTAPVTRRSFLRTTVAASAAVVPVATAHAMAAPENPSADAELFDLIQQLEAAKGAEQKAKDALEWLVDEYRHLWPLAPEAILGGAHASKYLRGDEVIETDIAGRPLRRETAPLTKRLTKAFRQQHERMCFFLDTSDRLQRTLESWRSKKPAGRTPRALERDRAWINGMVRRVEAALPLAIQYEAETARLRKESGVYDFKVRVSRSRETVEKLETRVLALPVSTLAGLEAKANVAATSQHMKNLRQLVSSFGPIGDLAEDVGRVCALARGEAVA